VTVCPCNIEGEEKSAAQEVLLRKANWQRALPNERS